MLNKEQSVQGSDTTGDNSSNAAKFKKNHCIIKYFKRHRLYLKQKRAAVGNPSPSLKPTFQTLNCFIDLLNCIFFLFPALW